VKKYSNDKKRDKKAERGRENTKNWFRQNRTTENYVIYLDLKFSY
jgi:hypothetical protein